MWSSMRYLSRSSQQDGGILLHFGIEDPPSGIVVVISLSKRGYRRILDIFQLVRFPPPN